MLVFLCCKFNTNPPPPPFIFVTQIFIKCSYELFFLKEAEEVNNFRNA